MLPLHEKRFGKTTDDSVRSDMISARKSAPASSMIESILRPVRSLRKKRGAAAQTGYVATPHGFRKKRLSADGF